ncbi:MAG: transcriptional repressor LexA [Desulfuromonadales bacterium]|nr:transcriptional repressor LexA [Desulfuromonadales bacterium]
MQRSNDTLTPRQQQVLEFITSCLDKNGYPPSQQEIARHLGVSGTLPVGKHLAALERKGCLRLDTVSRGIALANRPPRPAMIPIVGSVRAGHPEEAIENILGYCATDPAWTRGTDCFYLRVTGDSMIEAGIRDGDLALVRSQSTAENGEIVVALIDGEATLKRLYREAGRIRLQPANAALQPIIVEGNRMTGFSIIGKLLKIIRDYE